MGVIVSSIVFTQRDQAGTPRTEAWLTMEFQGAYNGPVATGPGDGGQAFDLSPYFRRIEHVLTQPVSGSELRALLSGASPASGAFWNSGEAVHVRPVLQDFGGPVSARFQIWAAPIALSGFAVREICSAPAAVASGIRFMARIVGQ